MSRRHWIAFLFAALLSFPLTLGIVVASGYRWNPYIIQSILLGAFVVAYSGNLARKENRP